MARLEGWPDPTVEFSDVPGPFLAKWTEPEKRLLIVARSIVSKTYHEGCCECAHEVIHALSPFDWPDGGTVLEEGLATEFQRYIRDEWAGGAQRPFEGAPNYMEAMAKVKELLAHDEDAINKLRAKQQFIGRIDEKLIVEVFPDLREGLAAELAKPLKQLTKEMGLEEIDNCTEWVRKWQLSQATDQIS